MRAEGVNELRRSGISIIGDIPWGTHFCQFYQTREDLVDLLVPYFIEGLKNNEFCMWVTADPLGVAEAIEAMQRSMPGFRQYLEKGQIEIIPYDRWYAEGGVFDAKRVLGGWLSRLKDALDKGYEGLRLTGNTFWIGIQEWDSFSGYESEVNAALGGHNIIALCTYCLDHCTGTDIVDVISNHEFALVKKRGEWELIESSEHKLTEEALRKSERQLRLISNITSDFVFELARSPKGGAALEWISEGFKRITTYDPEEIASGGWKKAVHHEDLPKALAWMMAIASGVTGKCRLRYFTKSGEVRWLELYGAPGVGGDTMSGAGVSGLTGAGKDVTDAVRAEKVLKKSEEDLKKAQSMALIGNWEWEIGTDNFHWSEALYNIFGLEKSTKPDFNAFYGILHPEDRGPFDRAFKISIENRGPLNIEFRIACPDASVRFIHAMGEVLPDDAGAVKMFGTMQDITERKKMEAKLLKVQIELARLVQEKTVDLVKSEERFKGLVETMNDWVWEIDGNGIYTYASPRVKDLLGYEPREIIGKTPFDLMPEDEARRIWDIFRPILEKREPFSCLENVNRRKDGMLVVLETSGAPFFGHGGAFLGYRGIDRDVTSRKKMEEERRSIQERLMQSQKMEAVGRLAGGIAHDFNNMVSIVRALCSLALKDTRIGTVRDYVAQISESADRASTLTRQLLIFSKKQPVKPVALNLNNVVEGMLRMLERVIGENITLRAELDQRIRPILADKGNIEQMIVNLVVNSRDALPEGGWITIKTKFLEKGPTDAPPVMMSVEDGGFGMGDDVKKRLFEPFFSTKAVGKGTGLGLAVVDDIVKEHGGKIEVLSEPGKGSCFRIYLPSISMPLPADKGSSQPERREGRGERILVVEDEKILRKSVALVLQRNGYKVMEASSAGEALSAFEKEGGMIDLVFTDLILQDMNGIQLMEEIERRHPGVAVLISSGYIDIDSQWPVIKDKGYRFLQKPYEIHDLLGLVSESLEQDGLTGTKKI